VEGVEGVGKGRERVSGCAACMSHSSRVLSSPLQKILLVITLDEFHIPKTITPELMLTMYARH